MSIRSRFLLAACVFSLAALSYPALAGPLYQVIDLGSLTSGRSGNCYPLAINNSGQIVGYSYVSADDRHAFLWENGTISDLGTLRNGSDSWANGINSAGEIVGGSFIPPVGSGKLRPFLWDSDSMRDLGRLPGSERAEAFGINDHGMITGCSKISGDRNMHFFTTDGKAHLLDHGAPGGENTANIFAAYINNSGLVAGTAVTWSGNLYGWFWTAQRGFEVPVVYAYEWEFCALNESGTAIGNAVLDDACAHPFTMKRGEIPIPLQPLCSGQSSWGLGINSSGTAVGEAQNPNEQSCGVIWKSPENPVDLNALVSQSGFTVQSATSINDMGWITAIGRRSAYSQDRGLLLKPIPQYAPKNVGISLKSGAIPSNSLLSIATTYSDENGYKDLQYCYLLIGGGKDLKNSAYFLYDRGTNRLYVRDNGDTRWTGGYHPGEHYRMENGYCVLDCAGTQISGSDKSLSVQWSIQLKSSLKGKTCGVWMFVRDFEDLRDGFDKMGTVLVK